MHGTNTFVNCYKSLVKFKASKLEFTAEKISQKKTLHTRLFI